MARATSIDVEGVIKVSSSISVTPFISIATLIVDRVYTCASNRGYTLSTDELLQIEVWLAAHFYALRDQQYISKKTGDASATFQGKTEMGLDGTQWGQAAKLLDPSGCLAELDKESQDGGKTAVGFSWLGKPPSEQTDYEDRD